MQASLNKCMFSFPVKHWEYSRCLQCTKMHRFMLVGYKLTIEVKFGFTGFASQVIISKAQCVVRARALFDG